MYATATAPPPRARIKDTLETRFTVAHDSWMSDADRFLLPVANSDATFWERWAALRYVQEHLLERYRLERMLLEEIRGFLMPEMRERLWMQADRLTRLLAEFDRLARQRESARQLARTTRELMEALRLWYAEIEFGTSGVQRDDLSGEGVRLLAELNSAGRCGWADANS
ncbi:MAG TPA: hypothetical protein VJ808_12765 [Gemmatimonadales bacterium]|nr:hypothetical protein [Gemmatimonadales bacterium]